MKRILALGVLTIAVLSLATPAQAHSGSDWYPYKWNLSEVGTNIKWGLMPDWYSNSAYDARMQDGADEWTNLAGNRDYNQRNDWNQNWTVASCSNNQEQNGVRKVGAYPGHPEFTAYTYRCPDNHGHLWSANIGVVDTYSFYTGTGVPGSGQLDLWSIAAHEFGHAMGFSPHWDTSGSVNICSGSEPVHVMCKTLPAGVVRNSPKDHDKHTFNDAY